MRNALSLWNNDAFTPRFSRTWGDFSDFFNAVESAYKPSCDVKENEKEYVFRFDVPGVGKDDIRIELKDNVLSVSGSRAQEKEEEKDSTLFAERSYGEFRRSFELPQTVDAEKIEASHKDGVLKVVVPKAEAAKPRLIKIA